MQEELHVSTVYKCLEKKNLILGFEIVDLLVLGFFLCALNLIFANATFKFLFTFLPVSAASIALRVIKTGKPDGYLKHVFKYHLTPGVVEAWPKATAPNLLRELKRKKRKNARFDFR